MAIQFYATINKRALLLFIYNHKIYVKTKVSLLNSRNRCRHWRSPCPTFAAILRHLSVCPSVYCILNICIDILN